MTEPDEPATIEGRGGKRDGAGRKAETTEGDKNGDGNFSEGLHRAARAIQGAGL